ncbi:MAG TPA: flagellar biosynthesis anti-sigma factor FlgM [Bryocella sp.]|nr:flagellar biosynthesis anti-sigma factor FlgM [Bryocella sp.]
MFGQVSAALADSLGVCAEKSAVALKTSHRQPMIESGRAFVKINPNLDPAAGQVTTSTRASGSAAVVQSNSSSVGGAPASADRADLSQEAQQFAALSSHATSVPAVRADRVASLKTAIQSGTYNVSNQQIAQSMVRDFGSDK